MDITSYLLGKKQGGSPINNQDKTITENGTYTADSGYTGLGTVTVNVGDFEAPIEMKFGNSKWTQVPNSIMSAIDWANITDLSYMFDSNSALPSISIPATPKATTIRSMFRYASKITNITLADISNVTDMNMAFGYCSKLVTAPTLNTSKVADMGYMFASCSELTTVPIYDTSKVTGMAYMFQACPKLTDESLNNILTMCINSNISYSGDKSLSRVGFYQTNYPASRIQALSNYQDFIDAGWTIGY